MNISNYISKLASITFVLVAMSTSAQFAFLGDGTQLSKYCLQLTPDDYNQKGWAFSTIKFDLDQLDTLKFKIYLGTNNSNGADGIAFMLHDDPRGLGAQGCVGEALGFADHPSGPNSSQCGNGQYSKITPSIGIEFDTWRNSNQGDPSNDHIAYLENGNVNHGNSYVDQGNIEDGVEHDFWFIWNPSTRRIHVYFDGVLVLNRRKNIKRRIFNNENMVYWGFSASTGGAKNQQYVCTVEPEDSIVFVQNSTIQSGDHDDNNTWLFGVPTSNQIALISPTHIVEMKSAFDVGGMRIENTGQLNFNGNTLNVTSGDFYSRGGVDATNGEIQFTGTEEQDLNVASGTTINNITVNNSNGVLEKGGTLKLRGTLNILDGNFHTSHLLQLTSESTSHSGRIAPITGSASFSGRVEMQRYVYINKRLWRYLSTPMSNSFLSDWKDDIPITGTFSDPSTGTGIKSNSASMYIYDETIAGDQSEGWIEWPTSGTSTSISLTKGKGYAVYQRDNSDRPVEMDVYGNINQGNIALPLTYTGTPGSIDNGWNLVGNPYPSQINWDNVSAGQRANVDNAIYFIDNTSTSTINRSYVNGIGNPFGTDGTIAPFQGFWVKANNANPSLTLEETDKTSAGFSFYRTSAPRNVLRMKIKKGEQYDEAVIHVNDDASPTFEEDKDALKLDQSTYMIGSYSTDGQKLAINAVSRPSFGQMIIPLILEKLSVSGTQELSFFNLETLDDDIQYFLLDFMTGTMQDIKTNPIYDFTTTNSTVTNRFSIVIVANEVITGIDQLKNVLFKGISVYPNPSTTKSVHLLWSPEEKDVEIDIMTADGVLVYSTIPSFGNSTELDLSELSEGMYIVTVKGDKKQYSQQLLLY